LKSDFASCFRKAKKSKRKQQKQPIGSVTWNNLPHETRTELVSLFCNLASSLFCLNEGSPVFYCIFVYY